MRRKATATTLALALTLAIAGLLEAQPPVKVNSADPPAAEQGTVGLDVVITGSGFSEGAVTEFFVTGTTNPGGVVVNGTTFVDSKHLRANISVSDVAVLGYFDVQVTALNGRTGKGIEKFSVQPKGGGNVCSLRPLPSQFEEVAAFEGTQRSVEFGTAIVAAPVETANPTGIQAIAVSYVWTNTIEVFLLDPNAPENIASAGPAAIVTIPNATQSYGLTQFDVDGDGFTDLIANDWGEDAGAFIYLAQYAASGLTYSNPPIHLADGATRFGAAVASGNLDSDSYVEIAVSAPGLAAGRNAGPGQVVVFELRASGPTLQTRIASPTGEKGDRFGVTLAVGDVTGDGFADLVVGAVGADAGGLRDAGATYVYANGSFSSPAFTLEGDIRDEGLRLAALLETGDGDGGLEIFADTGVGSSAPHGVVFLSGTGTETLPIDGLDRNYNPASAGDFDLDGTTDILLVGAQNASESNYCNNTGAVHAYFDFSSSSTDYVLQPPDTVDGDNFYGWAVAALNGTNLVLVAERRRDLDGDGTKDGLVRVYRVTP